VEYFHTGDPVEVSRLMSELPPSSLIINATGLGKDRPGSPVSDDGQFPLNGIAWDLNYRGELRFLQQARKQEGTRSLRVQDGWKYFIHGWATVIEEVFQRPITENELSILENEAVFARPASPTRGMREYP
jgi:shikimate 5-dehydrogenase